MRLWPLLSARSLLGGDVAPAVVARGGLLRDIAERDIACDGGGIAPSWRPEAAAARCLEPDDVAASQPQIADFGAQRRLDPVADQDEPPRRRRSAASEPVGPEAEAFEIRGEDRLRRIDAPLANETEAAAMRAGARRIGQQTVTHDGKRRVAFDHLDRD